MSELIDGEEVKAGEEPTEFEGLDELLNFHDDTEVSDPTVETSLLEKEVEVKEPAVVEKEVSTENNVEVEETSEQIISRMRDEIMRLSSNRPEPEVKVEEKIEAKVETPPQAQQQPQVWPAVPFDLNSLITDEELDQMIDKPEVVREALNRVRQATLQETQQMLPQLIQREVNRQVTISKLVTDFYDQNRDLIPYADFVSHVMRAEEQTNPTKTYKEIFETVAQESRKKLGLKNTVISGEPSKQTPAFAGTRRASSVRPQVVAPTGQAAELAELMTMREV